jgi:hypothetical protein
MKRGENITARTIYGYYKDESGKWEPDGVASEIVRRIYGYALDGLSPAQIREALSERVYADRTKSASAALRIQVRR